MMIQWQGANVGSSPPRKGRKKSHGGGGSPGGASPGGGQSSPTSSSPGGHHGQRRRRAGAAGSSAVPATSAHQETVESALNRLSRAYSLALECAGAWKEACRSTSSSFSSSSSTSARTAPGATATATAAAGSTAGAAGIGEGAAGVLGEGGGGAGDAVAVAANSKKDTEKLVEVGRTARSTFERALLGDPLVLAYAPAWESHVGGGGKGRHPALPPAVLNSASHRETVRKLAYLSLTNYSDLLLAGCPRTGTTNVDDDEATMATATTTATTTLLDRGLVQPLEPFRERSCWRSEVSAVGEATAAAATATAAAASAGGAEGSATGDGEGRQQQQQQEEGEEEGALEHEKDTVRRALVALLDATSLDGSDPTVWLKLACLARRLGRLLDLEGGGSDSGDGRTPAALLKHRRLERHALERGRMALPTSVPPWRPLERAWREFRREEEDLAEVGIVDEAVAARLALPEHPPNVASEVKIELTRYSWSALARILLRVCREGGAYNSSDPRTSAISSNAAGGTKFSSPLLCSGAVVSANPKLSLHLSPLLALPAAVLARLTLYLENSDTRRLEGTCRALSYSILSAQTISNTLRVAENNQGHQHQHQQGNPSAPSGGSSSSTPPGEAATGGGPETASDQQQRSDTARASAAAPAASDAPDQQAAGAGGGNNDATSGRNEDSASERGRGGGSLRSAAAASRRSRSSVRVKSQLLSAEKHTVRSQRRVSVEYCLVASTLGCTTSDPTYLECIEIGRKDAAWGNENSTSALLDESQRSDAGIGGRRGTADKFRRQREEARERSGDSSLLAFVQSCQSQRASTAPVSVVFGFVAHVSTHISDVFSSDQAGGAMVLSSSLLECIDLMLRRCQYKSSLVPSWSSGDLTPPRGAGMTVFDLFSIDLLHAELRFKRCDHEDQVPITGLDSDEIIVTNLIPPLLRCMAELDKKASSEVREESEEWVRLKVRGYWLVANYYFWRGRVSHQVSESREAEQIGLEFMEKTLKCFSLPPRKPIEEVIVPHLDSPTRSGQHWKYLSYQTVESFRDEIQASSIVLAAQEQFLEASSKIMAVEDDELKEEDGDSLFAIGQALFKRYDTPIESSESKHIELIDDFLAVHGDALMAKASSPTNSPEDSDDEDELFSWFDSLVPSGTISSEYVLCLAGSPCILSILTTCLLTKNDKIPDVAKLYSRLVTTIVHLCRKILLGASLKKGNEVIERGGVSDEDSSESSDGEDNGHDSGPSSRRNSVKLRQYGILLQLLIEKTSAALQEMNQEYLALFATSESCKRMLHEAFLFCADRFADCNSCRPEDADVLDDLATLQSTRRFFHSIKEGALSVSRESFLRISRQYVGGLMMVVCKHRPVLASILKSPAGRQGRHIRQKQILKRSQLLSEALCELGLALSTHSSSVRDGVLVPSDIFDHRIPPDSDVSLTPFLPVFCESLVWLFKTAFNDDGSTKDILLVAVAAAIVGLCGSASCSTRRLPSTGGEGSEKHVRLKEFYDTDSSAIDWLCESEGTQAGSKEGLLRAIAQTVHCVNNTFGAVDEQDATSFAYCDWYCTENGPVLPLVVARILNRFAGMLLVEFFSEEDGEDMKKAIWLDYPFGTETTGRLLDSLLYKAYRCLHGFALVHASEGKETSASATPKPGTKRFPAEDAEAAAMLYRCITRAYSEGRKSPPKAALETVLNALPPMEESPKSQLIRDYLFSARKSYFELQDLIGLVTKRPDWDLAFSKTGYLDWERLQECESESVATEDEAMIVRKGISHMLAQGAIPSYQDSGPDGDERRSSSQVEEELGQKFNAIIDDLSLGTSNDCEAWYKASQCVIAKADLIADRLGLSKGFARNHNFYVPERQGIPERSLGITELIAEQEREELLKREGWSCSLGDDLSVFTNFNWCCFNSLQSASTKIGTAFHTLRNDSAGHRNVFGETLYNEISALFTTKDFASWQQSWGGLFVSSLRIVATRCLCIALFVALKSEATASQSKRVLVSEICEAIGTILYSELSGSQVYGYPMQAMTTMKKRTIAEAALVCFERAVEALAVLDISGDTEDRTTWDLLFMVGKCNEKIANTYQREVFQSLTPQSLGDVRHIRKYEVHMRLALKAYADSLAEASEEEKDGFVPEKGGGSSHGAAEVFYRLHATRLKCLIAAVNRQEREREEAEFEGVRLTEEHWRTKPEEATTELRDRVWAVLSDIVLALVQCRRDNAFFHRSAYRHAQALMWAPVLFDPIGERPNGSLGTVPATRACKIRGLNYSTDAADSAFSVIGNLFDKKRPQLCAVWVTNSNSPFETINSTTRKYDSLRGKYISAYITSLRLCNKKKEIETFLRWALSSPRDLPSYFTASAKVEGGIPKASHMDDCLLVKAHSISSFYFLTAVKRQANSALAADIANEVQNRTSDNSNENENRLKAAYATFLRLNCSPEDLVKSRSWRFHDSTSAGTKDIVDALTEAYVVVKKDAATLPGSDSDWSGDSQIAGLLKAALEHCKTIFPNLSSNYYTTRKSPVKKKRKKTQDSTSKMVKKSYEVTIPSGLSAGDTFVVSIPVQDQFKKVRLTVPDQPGQIMRFSLEIAEGNSGDKKDAGESSKKAKQK